MIDIVITLVLFLFTLIVGAQLILKARANSSDIISGRGLIWDTCLKFVNQTGFWGLGPNFLSNTFSFGSTSSLQIGHCHNQFLTDFVNYGPFYLIISILLWSISFIKAGRNPEKGKVIIVSGALIVGITEYPFNLFGVAKYAWFFPFVFAVIQSHAANRVLARDK